MAKSCFFCNNTGLFPPLAKFKSHHLVGANVIRLAGCLSAMKRKRNSEQTQSFDLVLTDANGRSVRAHRALLVDKSEYFASVLQDHDLKELQLNENYLIELIQYLYRHDSDYGEPQVEGGQTPVSSPGLMNQDNDFVMTEPASPRPDSPSDTIPPSTGDIGILLKLLVLSRKYCFRQLYRSLLNEINYKLEPSTAVVVYRLSKELEVQEFVDQTKMMILSWLPRIKTSEDFLSLPEGAIRDIFCAEGPEIESESKLDALSAWWSHNKEANMTDLWVKIMMSTQ